MKRDGRKFDHRTLKAIRLMAIERVRDGDLEVVLLILDEERAGMSAFQLLIALERGEPSIRPNNAALDWAQLIFNPQCLEPDGPGKIGRRLRELLVA